MTTFPVRRASTRFLRATPADRFAALTAAGVSCPVSVDENSVDWASRAMTIVGRQRAWRALDRSLTKLEGERHRRD